MEEAFVVTFGCENCGGEWERQFPARTRVKPSEHHDEIVVRNKDCQEFGYGNCDCCDKERCPVCDLLDPVTVTDRVPLDGGETDATETEEAEAA